MILWRSRQKNNPCFASTSLLNWARCNDWLDKKNENIFKVTLQWNPWTKVTWMPSGPKLQIDSPSGSTPTNSVIDQKSVTARPLKAIKFHEQPSGKFILLVIKQLFAIWGFPWIKHDRLSSFSRVKGPPCSPGHFERRDRRDHKIRNHTAPESTTTVQATRGDRKRISPHLTTTIIESKVRFVYLTNCQLS